MEIFLYIQNLKEVDLPTGRNSWKVNETERKTIRKDLSFEVNRLSGNVCNATIKDLKDAKLLVEKARSNPVKLNFTKLGNRIG